jgi:hypothetical protein
MKKVFSILLFSVLSLILWGQEKEVITNQDGLNVIYQVTKVPVDTLKKVDPDIPVRIINEVYQKGLKTYDSTVVTCHYSYKNFWLKRSSDVKYKIAVYFDETKEIKTAETTGTWPKSAAYEIYVLLLAVIILFFSIRFVTESEYSSWDIQHDDKLGMAFTFPLAMCLAVDLIVYFNLGRNIFSLFVFSAAFIVLILAAIKTIRANWTQRVYLLFQKISLLSSFISLGVITHSIIFPLIIAALFIGILSIFIPIKFSISKKPPMPTNRFVDEEY